MALAEEVRKTGLAPNCHAASLNRLRHRRRFASLEFALAIERATGGEVKAEELPLTGRTRVMLATFRAASSRNTDPDPTGAAA